MIHIEPDDAQLPEMVRVQATAIQAFLHAATALHVAARPAGNGHPAVPKVMLDQLVAIAKLGVYSHDSGAAGAGVGDGMSPEQLRALWREQQRMGSELFYAAASGGFDTTPMPNDAASYLVPAAQLQELHTTVRSVQRQANRAAGARPWWKVWGG